MEAPTAVEQGQVARPSQAELTRNFRSFMLIWAAQLVARIGNGLTAFGLAVHVYQQTGLSTSVALVTMAAFLPAVLLAPLGGVLADRIDRRLLMILGDGLSALGLLALLMAFHGGWASVPVICGLSRCNRRDIDAAWEAGSDEGGRRTGREPGSSSQLP